MTSGTIWIVGAGPAGMMAAISAARTGAAQVTLFERMDRPGVKLLATGGGRCNLTNSLPTQEFLARFPRGSKFLRPALAALDSRGLLRFFEELGVRCHSEDGFHYFPTSESAASVRDALLGELRRLGVRIVCRAEIASLWISEGRLRGLRTTSGEIPGDRVVLAAGGKAYPVLGSNGSGYALAREAGHEIIAPAPALVPLLTRESWPGRCTGIVIPGARLRIDLPKHSRHGVTGDLLFTHRGISGPAALDISGEVAELLQERDTVPMRVHLTRESSVEAWLPRLAKWRESRARKLLRSVVAETLPAALADALCAEAGIEPDLRAAHVTRPQCLRLAELLAAAPLTIAATEGFEKAMVTRGGVNLRQVDPCTLQSRLLPGLFLAGEVLDVDGPCGGYNLQWAFSSGYLAGRAAATGEAP
jgi:predicted Rossmann fold flavoprotein